MSEKFFTTEDGIRRPATEQEIQVILEQRALKEANLAAEAETKAAAEAAEQQKFNDAVAAAVAAALATQQTPATTSEPVVEEPVITEE